VTSSLENPIADGSQRTLDPVSITAERITRAIFAASLAGGGIVALLVLLLTVAPGFLGGLLMLAGWAVAVLLAAAWAWLWPPVRYRHTSYSVDGQGIMIRSGVVWRRVVSVPRSRVQHTDVSQGPIERGLGLATLIIHTAGTQHASIDLSGLKHETAFAIRDHLIDTDEQDAV
jgi:membrane protein YdbS with pleckstrin-like domain